MTDVFCVRLLAERLATIAADCFDRRAADRLRELVHELHNSNPNPNNQNHGEAEAGGHAPA
jgi:phage portal protein BeeE